MTEHKTADETWESFADRKIREAQKEGLFDRLSGFGRPIADDDKPLEDNWWLKRKLRDEQLSVLPPVLEARLEVEKTLNAIREMTSEASVRRRLRKLNETIESAHYSPIQGPADGVLPLNVDEVLDEWKQGRSEND